MKTSITLKGKGTHVGIRWLIVLVGCICASGVSFAEVILADSKKGAEVDGNDLVKVDSFTGEPRSDFLLINSYGQPKISFLTVARQSGEQIGFEYFWPYKPEDPMYGELDVFYGVSFWNAQKKIWEEKVSDTGAVARSSLITDAEGKSFQRVSVRYQAPDPGTYRFDVGPGGNMAKLASPDFDFEIQLSSADSGLSFFLPLDLGLTQSPVYFYIPKGTETLELEFWDDYGPKTLALFEGTSVVQNAPPTRTVELAAPGWHSVKLDSGEDGSIARLSSIGFAFFQLYSVPMLWAKSPSALLVPRAIAVADGLVPAGPP